MARQTIISGNWKLNLSVEEGVALVQSLADAATASSAAALVFTMVSTVVATMAAAEATAAVAAAPAAASLPTKRILDPECNNFFWFVTFFFRVGGHTCAHI